MKQQTIPIKGLAVLLIDMQENFFGKDQKRWDLIPNHVSILRFCRKNNVPVVVIEMEREGENAPRTTEALMLELRKMPRKDVFWLKKKYNNGFTSTPDLSLILRELEVETLLLLGVMAGECVFETAETAVTRRYKIITSEGLIAGYCKWLDKYTDPTWYKLNGIYLDSHQEVIQMLTGELI